MVNGNLLRGKIAAKGLHQVDVAKAIEVSENTFSARMQGRGSFTLEQVQRICEFLGIENPEEKCDIFLAKASQ